MRLGLSHLCEHKFKQSFQDTLNAICNCSEDIERTSYYLFHCPGYLHERKTLLNTASCIVPDIFNFNNDQLTEILLYGKENIDNINNTRILDATINYFIETKRSTAKLFWWTLDVIALTLTFQIFVHFFLCFVFIIFILLLFLGCIFFIIYMYIFCFQVYHNIYIVCMVIVIFFV